MVRKLICGIALAAGLAGLACSSNNVTGPGKGQGALAVRLMDAAVPFDSIKAVNVFVVAVDARRARMRDTSDSAELNKDIDHDDDGLHFGEDNDHHPDSTLWVTIATPNKAFNLLDLQNGVTAFLGQTAIDTGHFRAVRIVIDPAKSSIVLKDGTVLTPTSSPPVEFENGGRHAVFVEFENDVDVKESATTTITLDIKLGQSVSLLGRSVHDGFFFRPFVAGHTDHD